MYYYNLLMFIFNRLLNASKNKVKLKLSLLEKHTMNETVGFK